MCLQFIVWIFNEFQLYLTDLHVHVWLQAHPPLVSLVPVRPYSPVFVLLFILSELYLRKTSRTSTCTCVMEEIFHLLYCRKGRPWDTDINLSF